MAGRLLEDRRVLITGASSGIGRALASEFAAAGAKLILLARNEAALREVANAAVQHGTQAEVVAGDVTNPQVRQQACARAADRYGGLDILINNAGVSEHNEFVASDEHTLRQVMEVNFFAAVELTRLALPLLRDGRQPAVVNIGSVLGHRGMPHNSSYAASKFALRGWSESLRAELNQHGIHVLLVSPGTVTTEFFDNVLSGRGKRPWKSQPGVSPAAVAQQTVSALSRGKNEIYPNWRSRLMLWVNRLCPRLVDGVMNRLAKPKP